MDVTAVKTDIAIERELNLQRWVGFAKSCSSALLLTVAHFTHNYSPTTSVLFLIATCIISGMVVTGRDLDELRSAVKHDLS